MQHAHTSHTQLHRASAAHGRTDTRARGGRAGRTASALETTVLIAIAVLLVAGVLVTSGQTRSVAHTSRVKVDAGDTLWELAEQHPVSGLTTAQTVEVIAELNHVAPGALPPHGTVLVPTGARTASAMASR